MRLVNKAISQLLYLLNEWPKVCIALRYDRASRSPASVRIRTMLRTIKAVLLDGPVWFSECTESLEMIRARRARSEHIDSVERWHRWLHARHSLLDSTKLGIIFFLILIGVSLTVGLACSSLQSTQRVGALASTLTTIAEVLGGAAGILFAVIVFGLQFQGERLGKLSFLVRYLRRREGLMPIAAFTLAVIGANIVAAILSARLPYAAVPMALADLVLVPVALWLTLYLLYRMAVIVSDNPLESYLPGLTWEYEMALDEEVHYAEQIRMYRDAVQTAGLEYSSGAGLFSMDPVPPVIFRLNERGSIRDINLARLKALGRYLRDACPDYKGRIGLGPGDLTCDTGLLPHGVFHPVLALLAGRDANGKLRTAASPLSPQSINTIDRLLKQIFRLGPVRPRDVVQVLNEFKDVLVQQASQGEARELADSLRVQEHLIEMRARRPDADESVYCRQGLPDYLGEFVYSGIATGVIASKDNDKILELLGFAFRLMDLGIKSRRPDLFHHASEIVVAAYVQALPNGPVADYVGDLIDNVILGVMDHFACRRQSRCSEADIVAEIPILRIALSWMLSLLRFAVEAERHQDAMHFHDRLWRWDRDSDRRFSRRMSFHPVSSAMREAYDLHLALDIVLAGWCLHVVRGGMSGGNTAQDLFTSAASMVGTRHDVLRVWEMFHTRPYTQHGLEACFGASHWTMPAAERSGVTTVYCGEPDRWVTEGFVALLLRLPSLPRTQIPEYFTRPPPASTILLDEKGIRATAEGLTANDTVRQHLLGVANGKEPETIQTIVDLMNERLCLSKRQRLTEIIHSQVTAGKCEALKEEILAHLEDKRHVLGTLDKLGVFSNGATQSLYPGVACRFPIRKEILLDSGNPGWGEGEGFAIDVGQRESLEIAWATETTVKSFNRVGDLAHLADAVRQAVEELSQREYRASVIFVPQQDRFVRALTGLHFWEMPEHQALGPPHAGKWDSCQILLWPYTNSSSLAVMDAVAFFGRSKESPTTSFELEIEEPFVEKHRELLEAAEKENDPSKIPDGSAVCVVGIARMPAGVGLRDANAAVRIDLDLTKLGYAMRKKEDLYHRPNCELLSCDGGEIEYSLAIGVKENRTPRDPCGRCKPESWDDEE